VNGEARDGEHLEPPKSDGEPHEHCAMATLLERRSVAWTGDPCTHGSRLAFLVGEAWRPAPARQGSIPLYLLAPKTSPPGRA
jgi:hypothetical protein